MRPSSSAYSFQVATWNVNFRRASILDALADSFTIPDIVTLQEVGVEQADAFHQRLAGRGLQYVFYSGHPLAAEKRYGNIIASRWPIQTIDYGKTKSPLPWPQLVAHAAISVASTPVHVITAHIPNGAGNGWAKIDTFRALAELVIRVRGSHCILTGDFNEPQLALQEGRIVTFGQDQVADGRYECWNRWTYDGRSGTGKEWDVAVRWFFESRAEHGMRHAFWEVSGYGAMEPTHISRGNPRWFDHILVSEGLRVESCWYLHEVRLKGFSDHSALLAELSVGSR